MAISLARLDSIIQKYSLLKHPFYVRWIRGELTLDDLRVYAKEYLHLVKRIPGIVARVRERMPEQYGERLKSFAEENEREEKEHVELWKRFANSLGISDRELDAYVPSAGAHAAVSALEAMAGRSFGDGVVTMYSIERELPKIAQTKKEGLLRFYGLSSSDAHAYFDEHIKEEKHLRVWREVSVNGKRARETAEESLRAQNQLLDAVCALRGIRVCL